MVDRTLKSSYCYNYYNTHTYTHTRARARARTHARMHAHAHTNIHINTRTHTYIHTRTHARTHIHTHTRANLNIIGASNQKITNKEKINNVPDFSTSFRIVRYDVLRQTALRLRQTPRHPNTHQQAEKHPLKWHG